MELKYGKAIGTRRSVFVWIEPLWNWNCARIWNNLCIFAPFELNLYGIEISDTKSLMLRTVVWIEPLWNWNFGMHATKPCGVRLNWTFMELKSYLPAIDEFFEIVWIEPLWNWNNLISLLVHLIMFVWIEPLWNWNIQFWLCYVLRNFVWIDPLWNWN